jgi:hypothetical protein
LPDRTIKAFPDGMLAPDLVEQKWNRFGSHGADRRLRPEDSFGAVPFAVMVGA